MRLAYRATFERCGHWARNFMALTALFSGVDCVVEKFRGKHDAYNAVISGCGVGAALSAKQGPQAACLGCAGFAIFSGVMEVVMGPH
ncbi:tim22-like protein [Nannochloropsis oceanica]